MPQFPESRFISSAWQPWQFPADDGTEVAFAGRSNAGKSSALNAVAGRKDLARTSKTPGRTQLINFFGLDGTQRLVDLPGYGFAKVPGRMKEHWQELLTRYVEARASLVGLVIVMDGAPAAHRLRRPDARLEPGQRPRDAHSPDQGRQAEPRRIRRGAEAGAGGGRRGRDRPAFLAVAKTGVDEARREVLTMLS